MMLPHVQTLFSIAFLYLLIAVEATPRLLLVSDSTADEFGPKDNTKRVYPVFPYYHFQGFAPRSLSMAGTRS